MFRLFRPGGGGGVLPYVCILGMCRVRVPHFQPWISVPEHIIFTNYQKKNPCRSITILHFCADFAFRDDHRSHNFFNFIPFIASHGWLSPNAKRLAAPRVSGRSGDSHFHAQNGSSSFRSSAFSRSKRLTLVPEPHIFTLDRELVPEPLPIFHFAAAHTYPNLGWAPPPPSPGWDVYIVCGLQSAEVSWFPVRAHGLRTRHALLQCHSQVVDMDVGDNVNHAPIHSKNYGVKITPPVLIEDYTMHLHRC